MSLSRNQIIDFLKEIDLTGKSVLDVGSGEKTKQARDYTKGEPKKYVTLDIDERVKPDIVCDINPKILNIIPGCFVKDGKETLESWEKERKKFNKKEGSWQMLNWDSYKLDGTEYNWGFKSYPGRNQKIWRYALKQYDIVFCLETLEHVWNPTEAVKFLYNITKEGGTCYISVPFINPIHDEWDYLRFTDEWFKKVLPKVGFRSVEIKRRVATKGLDDLMNFYKAESMRFSKVRIKRDELHKLEDIGYWIVAKK